MSKQQDIIFAKFPAAVSDHEPAHVLQLVYPDHSGRGLVLHLQEDGEALLGAVETPGAQYRLAQAYRCTETGLPCVQASLELVPGLQQALLGHREARVLMIRPNVPVHSLFLYVFPQILLS